jgi:hypothetical protein
MGEVIWKRDNLKLGIAIGLLAPLLSLVGYYFLRFSAFGFGEYLTALRQNKPLLTGITIPCLLLNVALFTFFVNSKRDKTARGIFAITAVYAAIAVIIKFFG